MGSAVASSMSVTWQGPRSTRRLNAAPDTELTTGSPSDSSYYYIPGDVITISVEYVGFEKSESTFLFLSLSNGFESTRIKAVPFVVSSTGSGSVDIDWLVPWNHELSGEKDWTIVAHASNNMPNHFEATNGLPVRIFSDTDSIFEGPVDGDIVDFDEPYTLRWNHSLLFYLDDVPGADGLGVETTCSSVLLFLVSESSAAATNATVFSKKIPLLPLDNSTASIANHGNATVSFPAIASLSGDKFYFLVECLQRAEASGWSSGYFYSQQLLSSLQSSDIQLRSREKDVNSLLKGRKRQLSHKDSPRSGISRKSSSDKHVQASCAGGSGQITNQASVGSGLQGISILGYNIGGSTPTRSVSMVPSSTVCQVIQQPPVPQTSLPTSRVPTRVPTASFGIPALPVPSHVPTMASPTERPIMPSASPIRDDPPGCNADDLSWLGDGYCDDSSPLYNTADCLYDKGTPTVYVIFLT